MLNEFYLGHIHRNQSVYLQENKRAIVLEKEDKNEGSSSELPTPQYFSKYCSSPSPKSTSLKFRSLLNKGKVGNKENNFL